MIKADGSKIALVIGIDLYRSEGLEDLPSCKKDAEDVCEILRGLGYTIFQNEPIIGSKLNKENSWVEIHRAIVSFFKSAKPGQTLLFYFSGHGIPREDEIYLAMPEVNTKDPMVEGFSLTKLTQLMKSSKSMQIVSIIDACYSGAAVLPTIRSKGMVAKETAGRALAAYDRILENIPKAEGRCFLLSSQAYEPSLAAEDNYSLYTKYLVEGLRGAKPGIDEKGAKYPGSFDDDGNVTPETLHKYLYHKVANEAEQVPKIKSDMASNIILAHYPYLSKNRPDVTSIVKEGDEHFLQDDYDKAIESYDRAIEADPYLVDAWHKKGNALYNKENFDEAIKCYDRASLINPNHFDSWYKKGIAYKKKNYHDQAIKSYDRAIQIRANNSNVWYEKGLSLSYLKRYEEAIKCYDNAIEINPKHAEAWYWKGHAFYDLAFNDREKVNEALTCYNRAREINPDFHNEWYGGGGEPPAPPPQPVPEPEPPTPSPSPLSHPLPKQPPSPSTRKFKPPIMIAIIAASAAAAVVLLLVFGGILSQNNAPPIAVAGTDKTVDAGSFVYLDGSSNNDPDNNDMITSYEWEQTGGSPQIILNNPNSASPSFTAPNVTSDTRFTFKLTVTDGNSQSAEDNVEITVKPVTSPPPSATKPTTNNAPVSKNSTFFTQQNTPITFYLYAQDADNDPLEFTIVSSPLHGSITEFDTSPIHVSTTGTYTPNKDYVGTDSFTFKVTDNKGSVSNTATVFITVEQVKQQEELQTPAQQQEKPLDVGVSIVHGSSTLTTDAYQPNPVQVSVGDTITWTNDDAQPHTVNSGENATPSGLFDSPIMAPAATFEHTFTEAGEFPYFCLLHPNMVGTVSVS